MAKKNRYFYYRGNRFVTNDELPERTRAALKKKGIVLQVPAWSKDSPFTVETLEMDFTPFKNEDLGKAWE